MSESITSLLVNSKQYSLTATAGEQLHDTFVDNRAVLLQNFYQGSALELLRHEAERLAKNATRRDFKMVETDNSVRIMNTVNGDVIDEYSSLIPLLYNDPPLCEFLSAITGERLYTVQDPGENYVLNILHQKGDTHGAHIDTYAYALITVLEAPNEGDGGCQELVPRAIEQKELDGPNVVRICPKPGDCVLLGAGDSIHRVAPLLRSSVKRMVIASSFANEKTLNQVSYSTEKLYG